MAFKMNRPIIKGSALHKNTGNNPNDLRETPEQYNARVRAEYEAKLKAHEDSTAAYNQAVIIDDLYNEGQEIKNQSTQELFNTFEQERKNKEAYEQSFREADDLGAQASDIVSDALSVEGGENLYRDEFGRLVQISPEELELLEEKRELRDQKNDEGSERYQYFVKESKDRRKEFVEGLTKGGKIVKEGEDLEDELQEGEIYPTSKRKLVKRGDNTYSYTNTAEDVKPGPPPREPYEMIDRIKIKNIDMLPTIKTPDIVEPTKRKYITSADGKWKYNLETGEKTRVKTQKVKKFRKPGKRSVRNLVTGGTNRVQ
jgi:hypothetical protein